MKYSADGAQGAAKSDVRAFQRGAQAWRERERRPAARAVTTAASRCYGVELRPCPLASDHYPVNVLRPYYNCGSFQSAIFAAIDPRRPMRIYRSSVLPDLVALGLPFAVKSASAAAGSLDASVGTGGVTVTSFASSRFVIPYAIKLQTNGEILVLVRRGI